MRNDLELGAQHTQTPPTHGRLCGLVCCGDLCTSYARSPKVTTHVSATCGSSVRGLFSKGKSVFGASGEITSAHYWPQEISENLLSL